MNTPISNQFFQCNPGYFTTNRIKTRQDDSFRRIVDDQIYTGQCFNGPDITAFTPDDTAFHFIIGQCHYRNSRFRHVVSSAALNSRRNDFTGFSFRFFFGFFFQALDEHSRFVLHFCLYVVQQEFFGIIIGKTGNTFQFFHLLAVQQLDFFLCPGNFFFLALQSFIAFFHGIGFLIQMFLFLQQAPFHALQFVSAFLVFPFRITAQLMDFFLPFEDQFLFP